MAKKKIDPEIEAKDFADLSFSELTTHRSLVDKGTIEQLVELHNELALGLEKEERKSFKNKAEAVTKVNALLDLYYKQMKQEQKAEADASGAKPKTGKGSRGPRKAPEDRAKPGIITGQKLNFKGKTLHSLVEGNPRRDGTIGQASFQIILNNPGITYENYLKEGGRGIDLKWDYNKGHVEVK